MKKFVLLLSFMISFCSCKSLQVKEMTLYVNYDYGNILKSENMQENKALILYNSSYINFDLGKFKIPDNLVLGDSLTLYFTGELYCLTSYPGQLILDGKLIDLKINYSEIVQINEEHIIRDENNKIIKINNYNSYDEYVIMNEERNYVQLKDYDLDVLYGSIYEGELKGLFAFEPR